MTMVAARLPDAQRRRGHYRRLAIAITTLAGLALTVPLLATHRAELHTAVTALATACPVWLSVGVLAEAVSYLTRGAGTHFVLRRAAPSVGPLALSVITLVGDAVAYVLPFGFAAGGAVALEHTHRRGVPRLVSGWAAGVATLIWAGVLVAVGFVAVVVATLTGGRSTLVVPGAGLLGVAALAALLAGILRFRRRRGHRGRRSLVAARLLDGWARIRSLPLAPTSLAAAAAGMLLSWLADLSVLVVAFLSLGEQPPWSGLVLAYILGQVASAVPVTPGGLGVVEGSLTAALVAFGGCPASALTAVLLYRLISHWAVVPAGALAWLALGAAPREPMANKCGAPTSRNPALG